MSENNTEIKTETEMETPKKKVYAFDDGSLQAKVMFIEHQRTKGYDLQSVQIKLPKPLNELQQLNLEDYIKEIPEEILNGNKLIKIDLHFTTDDFDKFGLLNQVNKLKSQYPNLSIIMSYSFMSQRKIERLAKSLGLIKEKEKGKEKEKEKPQAQAPEAEPIKEGDEVTIEKTDETTNTKAKKKVEQ